MCLLNSFIINLIRSCSPPWLLRLCCSPIFPRFHFGPSFSNPSITFHTSQAARRGGEMGVCGQFITSALCYSSLLKLFAFDMCCSHCCNNSGYTPSSRSSPWAAAAFRPYLLVPVWAVAHISAQSWCSSYAARKYVLHYGLYTGCKRISAQVFGAPPFPLPSSLPPVSVGLFLRLFFLPLLLSIFTLNYIFYRGTASFAIWVGFGQW